MASTFISLPAALAETPIDVNASQAGSWTVASTQSGPWTVASTQSGPWTVAATQSGAWNVGQTGTWSVRIQDGLGNNLTSQTNGSQRALDVGVNVLGVQVDPRAASPGTFIDRSGTATAASTQLMAANAARKYLFIQNLDTKDPIWINFTNAATTTSGSIKIFPGAAFALENSMVTTEAVNVIRGGSTNILYTAKEG